MDLQSTLDFVATVGYDVDFLRGKSLDLLATNPISKDEGAEHFDPRCAPAGTLAANGPWAARLLQGGGTFIDELAGAIKWHGSLDLPASARQVSELVLGWMEREWLPGTLSLRSALILLLAFCIGVDEFLCSVDSLDLMVYLGCKIGDLWEECVIECGDSLAKNAFRLKAAMTPFVGFCLCAYTGLLFWEDLTDAVGIYCYGNAFILDFYKRSTCLKGGNFTEGRGQLIGTILTYSESVLPLLYLLDILNRYRERLWGQRLPVRQLMLQVMKIVMERANATLNESSQTGEVLNSMAVAKVIEAMDAWDAFEAFTAEPSLDSLYRLPRPVHLAMQLDKADRCPPSATRDALSAKSTAKSWLQYLSNLTPPTMPSSDLKLTKMPSISQSARLPPIRMMEKSGLHYMIIRSPARPGGYASGHRDFAGRPAGASPLVA
ncbi:hypothetical protein BGZ63DRAFT_417662 [Mariannaea sp. PMI_226]|nr:hypothetical protein BGZ63DRAFT_417662 [Mariannaea sp. PMI_226]